MDPIMICFIMSTVLATPDAQNVTLQCPQVAQEEVTRLFEDLTATPTIQTNEDNNDNSRDNDNDNDNGDDLPSCDDDNRPKPGSCRDEHDYDECVVTPERCEDD